MEESYLASLIVALFFGLVFFKKDSKNSIAINKNSSLENIDETESSDTGVARYLRSKFEDDSANHKTGVEKYLTSKEESASGVAKYVAKQRIIEREKAKEAQSSVEKYLNNR